MRFKSTKPSSLVLSAALFFCCQKPFSEDIRRFNSEAHCVKGNFIEFLTRKEVPIDKNIVDEKRTLTKLATSPIDPAIQIGVPYKVYSVKNNSTVLGVSFHVLCSDQDTYQIKVNEIRDQNIYLELRECIK